MTFEATPNILNATGYPDTHHFKALFILFNAVLCFLNLDYESVRKCLTKLTDGPPFITGFCYFIKFFAQKKLWQSVIYELKFVLKKNVEFGQKNLFKPLILMFSSDKVSFFGCLRNFCSALKNKDTVVKRIKMAFECMYIVTSCHLKF